MQLAQCPLVAVGAMSQIPEQQNVGWLHVSPIAPLQVSVVESIQPEQQSIADSAKWPAGTQVTQKPNGCGVLPAPRSHAGIPAVLLEQQSASVRQP